MYVQYTAKALLDLVLHDEYTKTLMTDLFIEMLRGKDFNKEARAIVQWAIVNYLKDDSLGKKQLSWLLCTQVLNDNAYIRPGLYQLLVDYLD